MLTMSTFREERRLLSLELAGGARQVSISVNAMKREIRKLQVDFPRFLKKTVKLRIEVEDQATGQIKQIRSELERLDNWSNTTKFAENMAKALETAKKMVDDFNVSVSVGGKVDGFLEETMEASLVRARYAAKGTGQINAFDQVTQKLVGINPILQIPEAMKLISQSEQLQLRPGQATSYAEQAAQLGVTTEVAPKDLLTMMDALSKATGVTDAKRLANSIQYMNNNMRDFSANELDNIVAYSEQTGKLLDSPEKMATLVVEMDKQHALGNKQANSPDFLKQTAGNIVNGKTHTQVGNEAQLSYQRAIADNPFFEYQKSTQEAKYAMYQLARTVANDLLPTLKPMIDRLKTVADTLNGLPQFARFILEFAAAQALLGIAALKLIQYALEMKQLMGGGTACVPCTSVGNYTRDINKDKSVEKDKRNNNSRTAKQDASRTGSNPFGRFVVKAYLVKELMKNPSPKPTPNPNAPKKYVQEYRMPNDGQSLQRYMIPKKTGEKRSAPSSPKPSNIHPFSMPTHTPSMTSFFPNKDLPNLKLSGGGSLFRRVPVLRTLMGAMDIAQSDNKLETAARVGTEALGGWGGAAAGAAMGAMVGSIVPGIGTAIGGAVGGIIGGIGGSEFGGKLFDTVNGWWNKEPQPVQTPEPVTAPVPLGPPAPASSPASNPLQQAGSISVTIPQITVPLHAEGILQDIPTMLNMLNDPSVGQRIKTIIEKALLDALETRGGVAT